MKNITLTLNGTGREVMVNWDNVQFAKITQNHFGDEYVEVNFGGQYIDVRENLQCIHEKCLNAIA